MDRSRSRLPGTDGRPKPPRLLLLPDQDETFIPAPELSRWMWETFVISGAALENPDHAHLESAWIAALWTNVPNQRQQRSIFGTAEIPLPPQTGNLWARARWRQQMREWFNDEDEVRWASSPRSEPDFLITIYAPWAAGADAATWCAGIEHELYHCGQARDEYGAPRFSREGRPVYAIVGHDVEEHVGVVRRYGAGAAAGATAELVRVANLRPEVGAAEAEMACGTCQRRAA